jgi:PAS domain S-box-containing protein
MSIGLKTIYAVSLAISGALSFGVGYWVHAHKSDTRGMRLFVYSAIFDGLWVYATMAGLLVPVVGLKINLAGVRPLFGMTAVFCWVVFTFRYTGRETSIRNPLFGTIVAVYGLVVVGFLTNPLHHLVYASFTVATDPFTYVVLSKGPVYPVVVAWALGSTSLATYFLASLFVKSRHRSSISLLLLILGASLAQSAVVLGELKVLPIDNYYYKPFGVGLFLIPVAYAIFELGALDVRPLARDTVIDHVQDAIVILDQHGRLVDFNVAARDLFPRLDANDAIGRPFEAVTPALEDDLDLPSEPGETQPQEVTIADKTVHHEYATRTSTIVERGDVVGYTIVFRNVTERNKYRRELERQNQQLDRFASSVSHDLRNPLQVAFGRIQHMENQYENEETVDAAEVVEQLAAARQPLERIEHIITDLRALVEKGKSVDDLEPQRFESIVHEAWDSVATEEATFEIVTGGTISANRGHLLTILENLITNGIQHCPADVEITFVLTEDGFYVQDDGPGIPPEIRDTIFEYGYTTHERGSGFGLSIVQTMVNAHDWEIVLDEGYDCGARFVVQNAHTEPDDGQSVPVTASNEATVSTE